MTGDRLAPTPNVAQRRPRCPADVLGKPAAWVEATARRRVRGVGRVAGQDDAPPAALAPRRQRRCRRKKSLRVGMEWPRHDVGGGALFDDDAKIHDGNAVRDMPDHVEVVRDNEVGDAAPLLNLKHEVDDLRLNRGIER